MSERKGHLSWWVRDRSQCTTIGIFEEIAKLVERDVDEMNSLVTGRPKFFLQRQQAETMRVIHVYQESEIPNSPDHLCRISGSNLDGKIIFRPGNATVAGEHEELTIQHHWCRKHAQCRLSIHSGESERSISRDDLWVVVQEFLEPILFSDEHLWLAN